ncbi:hypothetical protein ACYULU_03360 [Breznakiellaceae bacterium SP9]
MKRMTMEEAQALDALLTETDPEFTDILGVFAKQRNLKELYSNKVRSSPQSSCTSHRRNGTP